jgi:hypothetical protein
MAVPHATLSIEAKNMQNRWIDYGGISKVVPFGEGYSHFMKGCVVDMLAFSARGLVGS